MSRRRRKKTLVERLSDREHEVKIIFSVPLPMDNDDGAVPEVDGRAYVSVPGYAVWLTAKFVGARKIASVTTPEDTKIPCATGPTGEMLLSLTWLEGKMPEYASLWARIRMCVEQYYPEEEK